MRTHVPHVPLHTQALEADPNSTKAMYRRAQAFMGQGDSVEAEQDVKRALILTPQDPDLLALQVCACVGGVRGDFLSCRAMMWYAVLTAVM